MILNKAIIIFSRMNSSRLPGKALMKLAGKTLLEHVITRAKLCQTQARIIVATSNETSDDLLAQLCKNLNVDYFRGPLNNLVLRTHQTMEHFKIDSMARVCGDRIF